MENFKEKISKLKEKNKFFNFVLDGKNLAIIILSFFFVCMTISYSSTDSQNIALNNKIQELNSHIEDKEKEINEIPKYEDLQKQITDLKKSQKKYLQNKIIITKKSK